MLLLHFLQDHCAYGAHYLCHTLLIITGELAVMKLQIFTLSLFVVIFLSNAVVEVTDENINSPLISDLLAKLQQLESKMTVRPNIRNTKQTT